MGLIDSINSINYEIDKYLVVIVDDGSDQVITKAKILEKLLRSINVQIVRLEQNKGITNALNKGLEFIYSNFKFSYIARLDCGDICASNRFYTQINFLITNPDIHLIGSWCYFKDPKTGKAFKYITPTKHKFIKRSMNFRNVFIHPTVMWRVSATYKLKYPENYPFAEDYGLFYDIVSKVNSAIINQFLVTCEVNQAGISISKRSIQLKSRAKVITDYSQNNILYFFASIKLLFLMMFPYQFIFMIKKIMYKA